MEQGRGTGSTNMAEFGDYIVTSARLEPSVLLDAHIQMGVSRFAFGPEEINNWTEGVLSENLSPSIRQLFRDLWPYKLEDFSVRYWFGEPIKIGTWIFNADAVRLLFRYLPLWPDDEGHRKVRWHFFKRSKPVSYLNQAGELVLLRATKQQTAIFENQGMLCLLRPTESVGPEVFVDAPPSGTWSVWDERDAAIYFDGTPPEWSPAFPSIQQWWGASQDAIIARQIVEKQWAWRFDYKEIVASTPSKVIAKFKKQKEDPHVWYNVLADFAAWRAFELGLHRAIKAWPAWRKCAACERIFHESSGRWERLGVGQIDICSPCLKPLKSRGNDSVSKEGMLEYLRALAVAIGRVPPSDFGTQVDALLGLSTKERVAVVKLLSDRPSLQAVKSHFGSWLAALVDSGVLADGTRRGFFGIECLARDGHRCLSLAEKTIDDFLTFEGIVHEKEVRYPSGGYRADFEVNGTLIEYFGLQSQQDYALKTQEKIEICRRAGVRLIEVYPEDLESSSTLRKKLSPILTKC
jgi:hypothetical protein